MKTLTTILALCAAAAGCAHTESAAPLPVAPEHDWTHGLEPMKVSDIAPVGPIENDQRAYDVIRRREAQHALGTKATALELDGIIGNSSQVLASALALPLFKAGVYLGLPKLIEKGCTSARRVTHSALRSSGQTDAVLQACSALSSGKQTTRASGCADGKRMLRDAYALLADDKGSDAGRKAAEGVQLLRDKCPKMSAPLRTPVDPTSRGFLIVWVLHANHAPPQTLLAGESAPQTAEAINEAFVRGVEALHAVAQNF
jgi:hypothetical protein